jgi:hypothetical protein
MAGRPSDYTAELADQICERIADGESLRSICRDESMPSKATVFRWLVEFPDFETKYAHAREAQADTLVDEIVSIADEEVTMIRADKHKPGADEDAQVEVVFDQTAVARNKLRVAARQWTAEKLRPKKYGPKLEIDQRTTLTDLTDDQLNARIAQLSAAAGG